jgi:hypothetical protein
MGLVESAPFNIGKSKLYEGVAGNLVAYACDYSVLNGDSTKAFMALVTLC